MAVHSILAEGHFRKDQDKWTRGSSPPPSQREHSSSRPRKNGKRERERRYTPAAFFVITLRKKLALSFGVRTCVSKLT